MSPLVPVLSLVLLFCHALLISAHVYFCYMFKTFQVCFVSLLDLFVVYFCKSFMCLFILILNRKYVHIVYIFLGYAVKYYTFTDYISFHLLLISN